MLEYDCIYLYDGEMDDCIYQYDVEMDDLIDKDDIDDLNDFTYKDDIDIDEKNDEMYGCKNNMLEILTNRINNEYRDVYDVMQLNSGDVAKGGNGTHTMTEILDEKKRDNHFLKLTKTGKSEIIKGTRRDVRPYGKIFLNGIVCDCLFDTGAKISVINDRIYKLIKGKLTGGSNLTRIACANGTPLRVLGRCEIELEFRGLKTRHGVFVTDEIIPEVIIGVDILGKIGIRLVFCGNQMTTGRICNLEGKLSHSIDEEFRKKLLLSRKIVPERHPLLKIILKHGNIFMANKWDIGKTEILKHRILTGGNPINVPVRRQPVHFEGKIQEIIENLEKHGIISKCESPWNAPIVCVSKKDSGEIRMCLDFRLLNADSIRPAFPIPNITEMMDSLWGSKYFSTIDLGNAYYQVELEESSREKTAFSTKYGQYCFNRMPFGIAAAPSTFQKLMTIVIGDMIWKECLVYLDDILIFSKTLEEHVNRVEKLFYKIANAGLKINPDKCKFLLPEVKFLGHIINAEGIRTDDSKIEAIKNFERPKCVKHVRSFLGLANYYRKFIKDYSKYSRPLESLINVKNNKIVWTEVCDKTFTELKNKLMNTPILKYPDFSKEFILDTDASFDSIGAVLSQKDGKGQERVIAYGSKSMTKHELGYCITRKELLAVFHFTQHFKHYLYGKRFILRTDHRAITFMMTTRKPITAQFQNWINFLSSLDIKLEYRKGEKHGNADALSRMNTELCMQCRMEHVNAKVTKCQTRLLVLDQEGTIPSIQENCKEIEDIRRDIQNKKQSEYEIVDRIIMKRNKIYVPTEKRTEFIRIYHKKLCHAGAQKIFKFLKPFYEMDQFEDIVRDTIRNCEICQERKVFTEKTKEEKCPLTAEKPLESLYIDFCGPMKTTVTGKKYILAIIDQFSKYMVLKAVKNQDDRTLIKTLTENWILKFGTPRTIHVDNGRCFISDSFKQLGKKYNFAIQYSSPYHHQANGQIERQFRTIRDWIYCCIKDKLFRDWEECLPHIEFTINATFQKTIKSSPAEIILGRRLNLDRFIDNGRDERGTVITEIEGNRRQYTNGEKGTPTRREFNIGDRVDVRVDIRQKDEKRYDGPYEVIERIHDRSYRLRNNNGAEIVRNVEWLKPRRRGGM
jgi:RNase H-like domain found in reverse transcriptase/Reverse transcriptase (RNA-dependent DNA polymerase)/Integrase core domain/Integrase zinc binding domain